MDPALFFKIYKVPQNEISNKANESTTNKKRLFLLIKVQLLESLLPMGISAYSFSFSSDDNIFYKFIVPNNTP